jgi:putative toxin-antitoxin system antitoxin component (TIGR02293 family)
METGRVVRMLGGEKTLGAKIRSASDLIPVVRQGFDYRALEHAIADIGVSRETVFGALGLPLRTMARRKGESRLTPAESDRLYRLVRIAAQAEMVFNDSEKARQWLLRSNRALGHVSPLSLLDTDEGVRQVEAVLGRIEHGVWS